MSANFHDLIHGFHSFKESYFMKEREFFDALAHGQSPKTLVIACCDSRADPALLMGCKPGDLFVIRSVAAIVRARTRPLTPTPSLPPRNTRSNTLK